MTTERVSQTEIQRRKKVQSRITRTTLVANGLGALAATTFMNLPLLVASGGPSTDAASANASGAYSIYIVFIGALLFLGNGIGMRVTAPLDRWYLAEQLAPPSLRVQKLALNNALISATISATMWLLAGILTGTFVTISTEASTLTTFYLALSLSGIAGPITTLLVYFATERLWGPEIALFFPASQPTDVQTFRLSVRGRLLVPFGLSVILTLVLALSLYTRAQQILISANPASELRLMGLEALYLLGVTLIVATLLSATLGRYITDFIGQLRQQMLAVREGRLNVQLPVTSNDELGDLAAGFNTMVDGLQQEEVIRRLFSLYVTPEVAEHAIAYGAALGGQLAEVTVLFSDIRGFTSMTEQLGPEAIIALLNRYFEAMSGAIAAEDGLVNKFGGDSLLAIFGSPLNPTPNHAARAVRAAQAMLAALDAFNADQRQRAEPELHIGIGVATGPVVAGNVGSAERLEYTVIGDTVNLASRLQTMTKDLDVPMLVGESTVARLDDTAGLRPLGTVAVRGKHEPVPIYGIKTP